jgi:regulator of protease activity HflC (stomatin/prohibitin superfamily)
LVVNVNKSIEHWGVKCTKFEISEIRPQNVNFLKQLELQAEEERKRRATELNNRAKIDTAKADKESMIYESEGKRISIENTAMGDLIMAQTQADAERYKLDRVTEGMKRRISELTSALGTKAIAADYILRSLELNNIKEIAQGPNNSVYFMPPPLFLSPSSSSSSVNDHSLLSTVKFTSDLFNKQK